MRTIRAMVALGMVAGALAVMAPQASAAGCLDMVEVQFDSPGDDKYSNDSLNAEYVKIKNSCASKKKLKGMTLSDEDKARFTFPKFSLKPNKSVFVHTGVGTKNKKNLFIGENNYIWNNGSDTAFLRNKGGNLTGRCSWDETDSGNLVIC